NVRICRMNLNIDNASIVIDVKCFLPGLTSVGSFVKASFLVFGIKSTHRTHPDNIRIGRMNQDLPNVLGMSQTDVFPSFTSVGGLVDSVACVGGSAGIVLASTNPKDVVIRFGKCHGTDSQ